MLLIESGFKTENSISRTINNKHLKIVTKQKRFNEKINENTESVTVMNIYGFLMAKLDFSKG